MVREDNYLKIISNDNGQKMVELNKWIPDIVIDLRYATTNNFMKRRMYPANTNYTFLRKDAADSLLKVQQALHAKGFGLKIFDAYRPYAVSEKFWELIHDERYVADPAKASNHNRGIAVDLTIVNLATGKELDMGTGFDNFTDSAHQHFSAFPDEIINNRRFLTSLMTKYGFEPLETEWWHFSLVTKKTFYAMNLSFEDLKNLQ
ncbi:MAG: M15 family metallopeptidase [Bacteroidetes bacterium]|nr:M15 family metallopeptidase [Bacteroidota bacterium]